jgi:hypothetical protein
MTLLRLRWGATLPDSEAGRAVLWVLVCIASLGPHAAVRLPNIIAVMAPWMDDAETELYIDHVNKLPFYQRSFSSRELGKLANLTNAQREQWKLWAMLPVDMTDEQLAEQRKIKHRIREQHRRRANGAKPRNPRNSAKPWLTEGISRRTYYYRQSRNRQISPEWAAHTRTMPWCHPKHLPL